MVPSCTCPACRELPRSFTIPLGHSLEDKVEVRRIKSKKADSITQNHHSYVPHSLPYSVVDHGIYVSDYLAGAITYKYPFANTQVEGMEGSKAMSVSRVTIVADIPNLASCSMAKSQELFERTTAVEQDIEMLVTWVIEGYEGSMFKALRDKGWEMVEGGRSVQPSNRPTRDIYEKKKNKWICPITQKESGSSSAIDW